MILEDFFNMSFEEAYSNPTVVLIAFSLIVFALVFSALMRTRFKENKKNVVVISLIISIFFAYYFRQYVGWLASFNLLLTITVIAVILIIGIPFLRFLRRQF